MYDAKKSKDKLKETNEYNRFLSLSDRTYFSPHISEQITQTKTAYIPRETIF